MYCFPYLNLSLIHIYMKQEVKVEKEVLVAPRAIFFTINRANITAKDKINLKYLADQIKQNPDKQ